jgi:hypothetical protein
MTPALNTPCRSLAEARRDLARKRIELYGALIAVEDAGNTATAAYYERQIDIIERQLVAIEEEESRCISSK